MPVPLLVEHLCDRGQPAGRARVPGHEHQLALFGSLGIPLEVMGCLNRGNAVRLVRPHEGDVERVARIREVVGISAVEAGLQLRDEHELDWFVPPVLVELVLATLIQRDDLTGQTGFGLALLLDRLPFRLLCVSDLGVGRARSGGAFYARRHIADAHELVEVQSGADQFVATRRRVEAGLHPVVVCARHGFGTIAGAVVVGHYQPVG